MSAGPSVFLDLNTRCFGCIVWHAPYLTWSYGWKLLPLPHQPQHLRAWVSRSATFTALSPLPPPTYATLSVGCRTRHAKSVEGWTMGSMGGNPPHAHSRAHLAALFVSEPCIAFLVSEPCILDDVSCMTKPVLEARDIPGA